MSTRTITHIDVRDEGARISQDEIFDVLSNNRRICVIRYLNQVDREVVGLRDVVDYVAACEHPGSDIEYQHRKSVYTALRQTHLPKLDDLGVIEFDKPRGELRLTERADQVRLYLEYVPENEIPWHAYYLGLTALSALLLLSTHVGIYPFAVGWNHLSVVLFAMFGLSAVIHAIHTRGNRLKTDDSL